MASKEVNAAKTVRDFVLKTIGKEEGEEKRDQSDKQDLPTPRGFYMWYYLLACFVYPLIMLPAFLHFLNEPAIAKTIVSAEGFVGLFFIVFYGCSLYCKVVFLSRLCGSLILASILAVISYGLSLIPGDVFSCFARCFVALAIMMPVEFLLSGINVEPQFLKKQNKHRLWGYPIFITAIGVGSTWFFSVFNDMHIVLIILSWVLSVAICFWFAYMTAQKVREYANDTTYLKDTFVVFLCLLDTLASMTLILVRFNFTNKLIEQAKEVDSDSNEDDKNL